MAISHRVQCSYVEISKFFRPSGLPRTTLRTQCHALLPKSKTQTIRTFHLSCRANSAVNAQDHEILESFQNSVIFPKATHELRQLLDSSVSEGTHVVLHGYLGASKNISKSMIFVPFIDRDLEHSIQVVSHVQPSSDTSFTVHKKLRALKTNTPVALSGYLKTRTSPEGRKTGSLKQNRKIEIALSDVQSLNEWPSDINTTPESVFPPEQRHLQIRTEAPLRNALTFRAKVADICRDELGKKQNFIEVETPLLFKSTPEGAREFIVPSRWKGLSYALPQSPQQFKQILMASGISRYYQIAKCFRDEDMRADRQPEFTQLDLEMSFATGSDVMELVENLTRRLWKDLLDTALPEVFPRMTYESAMSEYGSDKPDTRLAMRISRIEHMLPADLISKLSHLPNPIIEHLVLRLPDSSPAKTRQFINTFLDSPSAAPFHANPSGAPGIFIHDPSAPLQGLQPFGFEAADAITQQQSLEPGDLLVLQARPNAPFTGGATPLGNLRLALHRAAVKAARIPAPTGFAPLWITSFPLFTPTSSPAPSSPIPTSPSSSPPTPPPPSTTQATQPLTSTHHPFTSPLTPHDVSLLLTRPDLALADHYDLVLNGVELGGGSRRIHHAALQSLVLSRVLKLPPARLAEFAHLIEVLRAGCPPHAGFALGFDRLVAMLLGRRSVRDVIAFPKWGKGEDGLVGAPAAMGEEVLRTYHLRVRTEDEG